MTDRPFETEMSGRARSRRGSSTVDWSRLFDEVSPEGARRTIDAWKADAGFARSAFAAWRAARSRRGGRDPEVLERATELARIQAVGHAGVSARSSDELLVSVAESLQVDGEYPVVVVLLERIDRGKRREAAAFVDAPVAEATLDALVRHGCRAVGWPEEEPAAVHVRRVTPFDDRDPGISSFEPGRAIVAPVERRGQPIGAVVALANGLPAVTSTRLFFAAANQISLHLERIEAVRAAENDRFRAIFDALPLSVALLTGDARVLRTNVEGRRLLDSLGIPSDRPRLERLGRWRFDAVLASLVESGDTSRGPVEARLDDGRILEVTVTPFPSEAGDEATWIVVIADVTEPRRLRDELVQADKMSSLGQMISGIAHELNNPLAAINGYGQMMHSAIRDPEIVPWVEIVREEAERCRQIVQNLLAFARRHRSERKLLSVNAIVDGVCRLMRYSLKLDGIVVEKRLDRDLPAVTGDEHVLQQVLLNLVTNAQQAIQSGGGSRIVIETARAEGERVALSVSDDGPGVPDGVVSRVFDPFFTTKPPGQGTGLGLSLVYKSVAAHGGSVALDRSQTAGARFVVELPLGIDEASVPDAGLVRSDRPEADGTVTGRVLVVDDETRVATLIGACLSGDGHVVEVVHDGHEALTWLERERFDAIVLDYRMPTLDGGGVLAALADREPDLRCRVVLTSGDTVSPEPERLAGELGIPLVPKPFDITELREAVRERVRLGRETVP